MIPRRLMRHTLDLVYMDPDTGDRYGTPVLTETSRATVQGWMQMQGQVEETDSTTTTVTWLLALNPTYLVGTTVTPLVPPRATDKVEWEGRTYRCEGAPMIFKTTRTGEVHHYEQMLMEVVE